MALKIQIPIKYKFLAVLLSIMLSALLVFFYFTYHTFSEDKKLFVMDLNLTLLRAATSELKLELKSRLEELQILVPRVYRTSAEAQQRGKPKDDPFKGLSPTLVDEVLGVTFYRRDLVKKQINLTRQYSNDELMEKRHLTDETLGEINKKHPVNLQAFFDNPKMDLLNRSVHVVNSKGSSDIAILSFVLAGNFVNSDAKDIVIVVDLVQDFLRKKLQQSEIAELFLIAKNGNLLSHGSLAPTINYAEVQYPHPVVARLQAKHFPRESLELNVGGDAYLINISETGFNDIFVVSQIKKSEAFLALRMLLQKSALLAAVIVFSAIMVSILFAAHLTSNIQKLKAAAEQIGTGNLKVHMDINTNDEVQSVAESFVWMVGRLKQLIEESAQKARMEDELETARLVQSTLLTTPNINSAIVDLQSHYNPATECGGDFWDAFITNNYLTVIIGDATGHGAPAAIITAIAKSCVQTLTTVYQEQALTPDQLLLTLNSIIHSSCKGKLLMTMCIIQLNLETGDLVVCNAGHESPLCLRTKTVTSSAEQTDKKRRNGAEVLFARGERLGFNIDAQYEPVRFQLQPGDTLLLYTDGISEAHNLEGKEWGERSLKKVFAQTGPRSLDAIKNEIVEAVNQHTQGMHQEDDITFVLVNWKASSGASGKNALPDEEDMTAIIKKKDAA